MLQVPIPIPMTMESRMRAANNVLALAAALAWLTACSDPAPSAGDPTSAESATGAAESAAPAPAEASDTPPPASEPTAPAPAPAPPASDAPAFVGTTWKVVKSDGVQAGTTYTFNADGSLVIASAPGNPPGEGKWAYADGKLVIEEEGASYPTDILRLDAAHFDIRSHNPGGTLDIQMVPATH